MTKKTTVSVLVLAGALAACGGGSTTTTTTEESTTTEGSEARREPTAEEARIRDTCVRTMTHERECSPQFVEALVSLRARLDHPAGFHDRDVADHAGLVAEATTEWQNDSTDPRIGATCTHFSELPADQTAHFTTIESECIPMTDCAAFVQCDMRFVEERFTHRAGEGGEAAPAPAAAPAQ
jgi:hypothetical protein